MKFEQLNEFGFEAKLADMGTNSASDYAELLSWLHASFAADSVVFVEPSISMTLRGNFDTGLLTANEPGDILCASAQITVVCTNPTEAALFKLRWC